MASSRSRKKRKRDGNTGFEIWGGYMAAKISKLQHQYDETAGKPSDRTGIFSGIAVFVNGYTEPSADEIKRIMIANGGTFHHYYSKAQTTHIVASNLPNSKIITQNTDFIVSPKWITDSLAAGQLLDYKKYLLYTKQSLSQPKLPFVPVEQCTVISRTAQNENTSSFAKEDTAGGSSTSSLDVQSITHAAENGMPSPVYSVNNASSKESKTTVTNTTTASTTTPNAIRLNPSSFPKILSTANPNFLSEFYNNSRLHHISTSGATFKQYVKDLQNQEDNFYGRHYLKDWLIRCNINEDVSEHGKVIMHIDMDCFFVSVGLIRYPELKNMPVAVTHARKTSSVNRNEKNFQFEVDFYKEKYKHNTNVDLYRDEDSDTEIRRNNTVDNSNGRISKLDLLDDKCSMSEIASCSYEARKCGIKNGMFLGAALKLCPELRTIPYDFDGYTKVSKDLYNIIASYTKDIEAVSCDEMFVDLTNVLRECAVSPSNFAACLREQIQVQTKCCCSSGLGPNMLIARLATRQAKPNGQFWVASSQVAEFMKDQNVSDLPGVGTNLRLRLDSQGIRTCSDLQQLSLKHLQQEFGTRTGKSLHDFCRGIDDRSVSSEHQRKSVSAEVNYGIRFQTWEDAEIFVRELSGEVAKRLLSLSLQGRTVTMKLKVRAKDAPVETAKFMGHGVCDNIAKSTTLSSCTCNADVIFRASWNLLKQVAVPCQDLRGVGIQISKLMDAATAPPSSSIESFLVRKNGKCGVKEAFPSLDPKPDLSEKMENEKGDTSSLSHKTDSSSCQDNVDTGGSKLEDIPASSTVDLEVLSALPVDIRDQIIEEYRSHGYHIPELFSNGADHVDSGSQMKNEKGSRLNLNKNSSHAKLQTSKEHHTSEFHTSQTPGPSKLYTSSDVRVHSSQEASSSESQESNINIHEPGPLTLNSVQNPNFPELCTSSPEASISDCDVAPSGLNIQNVQYNSDNSSSNINVIDRTNFYYTGKAEQAKRPVDSASLRHEDRTEKLITSFSQIDQSFLNALPNDVQNELKSDFDQKKKQRAGTNFTDSTVVILRPPQSNFNSNSKRKRGRPKGQKTFGRRQKTLQVQSPKKALIEIAELSEESRDSFGARCASETNEEECLVPAVASLCGQVELDDVKNLISQWLESCNTPDDTDIEFIIKFCQSLILEKDLEKLDLILKFLYRRTQTRSKSWRNSFRHVYEETQALMVKQYKAELHLDLI